MQGAMTTDQFQQESGESHHRQPSVPDLGTPVGLEDLLLTLLQRNQAELQEQLGDTAWERLLAWAQVDAAAVQTQAQLVELWQVKQPSVSQTLQQLIEAGAVEALPRRGREVIQYLMTGTARLAF
jgi:DNA-binding MarR family transcriptional regulator